MCPPVPFGTGREIKINAPKTCKETQYEIKNNSANVKKRQRAKKFSLLLVLQANPRVSVLYFCYVQTNPNFASSRKENYVCFIK